MSLARILAATCLLGGATALAGPTPTPTPAQAPAKEAKHITIKFQGTLREALKAIADKGGINLIITGELSQPGEVYLTDVPADQALQIVADAHALKVRRQGSIWTIRPLTAEERALQEASDDGAREGSASAASSDASPRVNVAPGTPAPPSPPSPPDAPEPPAVPDAPEPPDALDSLDSMDPADAPALADGETPDPVTDPKGFQRHIEERVQRDLRAKLMRKFRNKRFDGSGKNDMVGTGHVVVEKNQTVGTVVSFGGGLDVKGHVEGDAVAFGGGVRLGSESEVEGDVVSFGGSIIKEDGAEVGGEEVAFGGSGMGRVMAAPIPITISSGHDRHDHDHDDARPPSSNSLAGFLAMFAVLFGGGFLSMMFAPNRMKLLEAEIRQEPLRCGLIGLLGAFGLPILTVMLVMTVIGILLVPVLWVVVAVGCLMGIAALANQIGTRLPLRNVRKTQAVVLALGVLLLELVGLIPVVGALAWCAVFALSLGAIIRSRFGTRQLGTPVPV